MGALEVSNIRFDFVNQTDQPQIGDSKMDSGALEPGETLNEEFDMERDFLPEELVWLMDEMLNREVC